MRISQKGLCALQATALLARQYDRGVLGVHDIAYEGNQPEKLLELVLLELKNARVITRVRGGKVSYRLSRPPSEIYLSDIIRLMDGPLAPFGDAGSLDGIAGGGPALSVLRQVFRKAQQSAARILEKTSLANVVEEREIVSPKRMDDERGGRSKVLPVLADRTKQGQPIGLRQSGER